MHPVSVARWVPVQWSTVLAHCPFILSFRADSEGHIEEANIEFARVVGIAPSKLIGSPLHEALGIDSLEGTIVGEALRERRAIHGWCTFGGLTPPIETWAFPVIRGGQFFAVKVLAAHHSGSYPGSKIKRPKRIPPPEIAPSMEHLKRFAAAAAHEIDNSLTAIYATAQLMQAVKPDPETIHRLSQRIETAARQASLILNDLKVLGAPIRREEIVQVNDILKELAETRSAEAAAIGAEIKLRTADDLPPVLSHRSRLRQVFVNLIRNGLDAIAESSEEAEEATASAQREGKAARGRKRYTLTIRSRRGRENRVIVSVYNRGKPIPPESRDRLFEPFFSTKQTGSGLGLPICKEIVEAGHEGTLDFRSSELLGTVFRVTLPPATSGDHASQTP